MRVAMPVAIAMVVAALIGSSVGISSGQIVSTRARCLHDRTETRDDRSLRDQAVVLARGIEKAEAEAVRQSGRYRPVEELSSLPSVPEGFALRLYLDSEGYLFSLKDTRDLCRFGIFSDQSGTQYSSALPAPQIAAPR